MFKIILRKLHGFLLKFGFNLKHLFSFISNYPSYFIDLLKFIRLNRVSNYKLKLFLNPQLQDKNSSAGDFKSHYFWQDLLVAREIFSRGVMDHYDIGSRIDGFIAHLASGDISVTIFDIRNLDIVIPNVTFRQLDLMNPLPAEYIEACSSLSCLHTLEHFGLGRYGDGIDPDGHLRGLNQLWNLLKKGGLLYLSVPIGHERVEFNAHRVFDAFKLYTVIKDRFNLVKFILIDDDSKVNVFYDLKEHDFASLNYSCGIYVLEKI